MSRLSRRSLSSCRRSVNLLAVCFSVAFATLAADASAVLECRAIGPLTAGVPFSGFVAEGVEFMGTVPPSGYIIVGATINWGDGTVSEVEARLFCSTHLTTRLICDGGFGGGHTYSQAMQGVRLQISSGVGSCISPPFQVDAPGPPPPGGDVLSDPKLVLGRAPVNVPVTGVIATFSDSNPSAVVSDFTAVIDWGDGTQSNGVVSSPSAGTLDVSAPLASHIYVARGSVTVSVSLSAPGVTASTATGVLRVGRSGHR